MTAAADNKENLNPFPHEGFAKSIGLFKLKFAFVTNCPVIPCQLPVLLDFSLLPLLLFTASKGC